ncbi:MAG: hypothetical protein P1U86_17530 [Verrucomicrobiales bacterium]|nr:hypothetical protein [Verrucomicrobiales bacterium]
MIRSFLTFTCLFVFTGGLMTAPARSEPLSGGEVESILKELTTIEEVLKGDRVSIRTSAVRAFEAAAASDKAVYEFYLQCHKTLKFDAKDASFTDFRAWREKNEERIKDKSNLAALRLQLQYLVLTLKAAEGVKREVLIPELEGFVANIVAHSEELEDSGMKTLRESVKTSIFAEAYKLDKSLEVQDWSFEPGRFGNVYESTIFPFLREEQPGNLGAAWDRRIELEKRYVLITEEENQFELDKFQTERLPELHWQKAKDLFSSYSPKQGAQSMLAILKGNPGHTSLKKWVEEFRTLLQSNIEAEAPSEETPPPVDPANPLGFE